MESHISTLSDYQLQKLLSKGNDHAFTAIFERYWKRLYSYAFRIYTEEKICEDIVQEVFISLWEKADITHILNLEGYLLRSVKYRIANHIRDLKFTTVHEEILQNIPSSSSSEKQLEYDEFEKLVRNEINKLPPRCERVFTLSRFENLSNSEIAQKLNISIRTVEKHISDALKHLKSNVHSHELSLIIILMFH
ncbi:MAG: RNA polymerase sigma-70 factor [Leeuwenhoekiella sp.]